MCSCILTDRARDLLSFVSDHEGMNVLDHLLEQVAGVEAVGAQYFELDNSHCPEEEQGEGYDVNGHHQQHGPSLRARNASGQPAQGIEVPLAHFHPAHSSE